MKANRRKQKREREFLHRGEKDESDTHEPADRLLAEGYRNALRLAEENEVDAIAFPALSTGAFGYPMEEATAEALQTYERVLADVFDAPNEQNGPNEQNA